jgi:hypothetical protein
MAIHMRKSTLIPALTAVVCLVIVALAPSRAEAFGAPRQNFGIGIGQGTGASGLSGKFMIPGGAIQGVLGFWGRFDGGHSGPGRPHLDGIALSVDYLFEMPSLARSEYFSLDWCFGLGGGIGVSTGGGAPGIAAAGIAGLEFNFTKVPLDVAIEYRPAVGIVPDPWIGLVGFTAHVRLWF